MDVLDNLFAFIEDEKQIGPASEDNDEAWKAKDKNIKSWRTVINTGEESGQTVFHLHIHFLAGKIMKWPPG